MRNMTQQESQNLEHKTSLNYKAIVKSVVAFANSQGGRIKVGVNDDDQIIGIKIGIEASIAQKNTASFDSKVLTETSIDDISLPQVKDFLTSIHKNYNLHSYLISRNCVKQELTPTVAGILLFEKSPQSLLVQSHITLVDCT